MAEGKGGAASEAVAGPTLSRAAEEEWRRLRRHIDLAAGFWVGFVFAPEGAELKVLRDRCAATMRALARPFRYVRLAERSGPGEAAKSIAGLSVRPGGCLWVEYLGGATWADGRAASDEDWGELCARLNEQRERLRRRIGGGLVLCGAPACKPLLREMAPDLWSIRALVVELTPSADQWGPALSGGGESPAPPEVVEEGPGPDPLLALREAERVERAGGDPRAAAMLRRRAAEGLLARGDLGGAERSFGESLAICRRLLEQYGETAESLRDLSVSLSRLADLEAARGDPMRAEELRREAQELARRAAALER